MTPADDAAKRLREFLDGLEPDRGSQPLKDALRAVLDDRDRLLADREPLAESWRQETAARLRADAELERLRAVIRETHAGCDSAWTDRGLHAPECKLYEIEEGT